MLTRIRLFNFYGSTENNKMIYYPLQVKEIDLSFGFPLVDSYEIRDRQELDIFVEIATEISNQGIYSYHITDRYGKIWNLGKLTAIRHNRGMENFI